MSVVELEAYDGIGTTASWIGISIILSVLIAGLVACIATALRASVGLGKLGKAGRRTPRLRDEGVFAGIVERAPGDDDPRPPVSLEVRQQRLGRGRERGRMVSSWIGAYGRPKARPFVLRLASGEGIAVEPGDRVQLIDALDDTVDVSKTERIRRAMLEVGEQAHVVASVDERPSASGGYRGGGKELVLRPPRSGAMLLSSEDELAAAWRKRRAAMLWVSIPLALATAFAGGLIATDFFLLSARGRQVEAPVDHLEIEQYTRKGRAYVNYYVVAKEPRSKATLRYRVEDSDFVSMALPHAPTAESAQVAPDTAVPFVVDDAAPGARYLLGRHAFIAGMDLVLAAIVAAIAAGIALFGRMRAKPWYEKEMVVENSYDD